MSNISLDFKEVEALDENSTYFEQLAIDLLSQCHQTDRELTHKMLTRNVSILNGRSCLQLAATSSAMKFISHPNCLALIDNMWHGQILPTNSTFRILVASFFPPILFTLKYRSRMEIKEMTAMYIEEVLPNIFNFLKVSQWTTS